MSARAEIELARSLIAGTALCGRITHELVAAAHGPAECRSHHLQQAQICAREIVTRIELTELLIAGQEEKERAG